ncbi:MAG: DUF3515 domain-containing protein [Jatrophihabitantaceae bacterium]
MTLPVIVIVGLVIGRTGNNDSGTHPPRTIGAPLPALILAAPPSNPATVAPCVKVLAALPVELDSLAPRIVHPTPDSPFVVAWGDPPVVLRCGVDRPANLQPGSADFVPVVNGVAFFETDVADGTVYTSIDRATYIEVTLPKSIGAGPLPALATAIAKALPAVCVPQAGTGEKQPDPATLCTHRK